MTAAPPATRERIDYLDSIRGLAALYVVLFHAGLDLDRVHLPLPLQAASDFLGDGKLGVALFIVLSGYCLMLPVARAASFVPRLRFCDYLVRRAWRIYPSYLVALFLSIVCLRLLDPAVRSRSHWLDTFAGPITWQNLIAHLLLAHNLSESWIFQINAPFWSVATEWQIYFFFPVLLALARWTNFAVAIAGAFAVSILPMLAFHRFEAASPWFLGLFAMGMAAAAVTHSSADNYRKLRQGRWWLAAALPCCGATLVFSQLFFERFGWKKFACEQACWGAAVSALLIWLATPTPAAGYTRRLLHWKPLVALGRMSYSLYLTHAFVVSGVVIVLSFTLPGASPAVRWLVATVAGGCLSVAFASVFYLLCERTFMNARRFVAPEPADLSAAESPRLNRPPPRTTRSGSLRPAETMPQDDHVRRPGPAGHSLDGTGDFDSSDPAKTCIVYYHGNDWDGVPARQRYLMQAMARYVPVFYLDQGRDAPGRVTWRRETGRVTVVRGLIRLLAFLDRMNLGKTRAPLAAWLLRTIRRKYTRVVYWAAENELRPYRFIPHDVLVFDSIDPSFDNTPEVLAAHHAREVEVLAAADVVFATADLLAERCREHHRDVHLLNNACEPQEYSAELLAAAAKPAWLPEDGRPVAAYLGTLDRRVDVGCLLEASARNPEVRFVLAGQTDPRVAADLAPLRGRPNVTMPGRVSVEDGRYLLAHCAFGMIPFVPGTMNDAVNPVKMYAYALLEKPVLGTAIRELASRPQVVRVAADAADFARMVLTMLTLAEDPGHRDTLRRFALENTWAARAEAAHAVLKRLPLLSSAAR